MAFVVEMSDGKLIFSRPFVTRVVVVASTHLFMNSAAICAI